MKKTEIPKKLLDACKSRGIIIFAGAGVSMAAPSCLPSWYGLNELILDNIGERIEEYLDRKNLTTEMREVVHKRRKEDAFPPDYQAQILAESCGENYFRALQAVDVCAYNEAHRGIALLAKHGVVRAIVTTNFDRLIEKALDESGVQFKVAFDPETYELYANLLETQPLVIWKIHGCVQDHHSLIDTLKQRLLGRNAYLLQSILKLFQQNFWLCTGFSAADLESDSSYLGLLDSAIDSPGMIYVLRPNGELRPGAQKLIEAYGPKASIIESNADQLFRSIAHELKLPEIELSVQASDIKAIVSRSLSRWSHSLSSASAINCFAGVLEATGSSVKAFEMLHRFWRNVLPSERNGNDFESYQLMHGRLGMGMGILSVVEDLSTDKGMESFQNLLRVADKDFRAFAWAGLALVWAGNVQNGIGMFQKAEPIYLDDNCPPESKVDFWLALAEALFLTGNPENIMYTWGNINNIAIRAGDLPRQARVVTFFLLIIAEYHHNLFQSFHDEYVLPIYKQASRLHDPSIEGYYSLACGRHATKLRNGKQAIYLLSQAINQLEAAGRFPWCTYAMIEYAKALMDECRFNDSADMLDRINIIVDRNQLLLSWYEEARGQHHRLIGRKDIARQAFIEAVEYAKKAGLVARVKQYELYLTTDQSHE